ncbi:MULTISPECIES: hypothetical protein [Enterococcus]|uniref:Uncharacterized protein n=1 Tax=Enterococcus alcedinis TaxID=1274384 RepID=A0A917JEY4_9ENTE|nr:hypothetical protein [Enterococcus alcedinis]MBP2100845.1 mannitol-specific phosphotransferase system IIBC component [Enterococcus alcedinis]GGI64857.1 hypothetical protein GCM10011482_05110 [Enterococcus alcedinis]
MKAVRRFGLLIGILLMGVIIGNFGMLIACLVLGPLLALWLILWDDKNSRQAQRQQHYTTDVEYYYDEEYYYE